MLKKLIVFNVLAVVFFAASWSLFRSDFFHIHDFTHGARIVEMTDALSDGHFPVRWSSDFGFGYGMPLFEFYAPLPYCVGSFFYSLGFSLVNSIKILFLISTIVTLVGGYYLGKILFGRTGGLLVSAVLTLAPYRALNLFIRGAISEAWGIMAIPLILLGIILVVRKIKSGWILLLFSLLTLFLSHNLTTMMFLPLSLVFGAVYLWLESRDRKKPWRDFSRGVLSLAGVYFLAVMISSFYLVPALLEKDFTKIEGTILSTYFNYELHFLYIRQFFDSTWKFGGSGWGPDDDISFYLGFGQLASLALAVCLFAKFVFFKLFQNSKIRLNNLKVLISDYSILFMTTGILLVVSLFMTLTHSSEIWKAISFFEFIQFPWRWLSLAIVFLAVLSGFSSIFIKNSLHRYFIVGLLITTTLFSSWRFFQPESYLFNNDALYYEDRGRIREAMSGILPDYIPSSMTGVEIDPVATKGTILLCEVSGTFVDVQGNEKISDGKCEFEFSKLVDKTQQKLVEVDLPNDTLIEFAVADFPGWVVEVDGELADHQTSDFGVVSVPVAAGQHKIGLDFRGTTIRSVADTISLLGLIIFVTIYIWGNEDIKQKIAKTKLND